MTCVPEVMQNFINAIGMLPGKAVGVRAIALPADPFRLLFRQSPELKASGFFNMLTSEYRSMTSAVWGAACRSVVRSVPAWWRLI